MIERDWDSNDIEMVYDGGHLRIYDGWIAARLRDGRIVNRWYEGDMRWERTEAFIAQLRCGCPDDRCAGYHHGVDEPCGCTNV